MTHVVTPGMLAESEPTERRNPIAHHNRADCDAWPCKPGPPAGHHPEPTDVDEDDGTTGEARVMVQPPREQRPDDEN